MCRGPSWPFSVHRRQDASPLPETPPHSFLSKLTCPPNNWCSEPASVNDSCLAIRGIKHICVVTADKQHVLEPPEFFPLVGKTKVFSVDGVLPLEGWRPITATLLVAGIKPHQGLTRAAKISPIPFKTSTTSYLERVPPVLLDSGALGWSVAMVTLP